MRSPQIFSLEEICRNEENLHWPGILLSIYKHERHSLGCAQISSILPDFSLSEHEYTATYCWSTHPREAFQILNRDFTVKRGNGLIVPK